MKWQGRRASTNVEDRRGRVVKGAVGDDRIQKNTQGYAMPESFTHGTSEQRQRWFYKGFISGTLDGGDTFNTDNL